MEIFSGYDFDDVLLMPLVSQRISSRNDPDVSTYLGRLKLRIPIVASPMEGIVGVKIIKALSGLGGIGILHRFFSEESERTSAFVELKNNGGIYGISVGINDRYKDVLDYGASIICIDVANGYLERVSNFAKEIATYITNNNYNCELMAGNVATLTGARFLYNSGASIIRVGIGSGQLCSTRNKTGVGVPQLTAVSNCSREFVCVSTKQYPESPIWRANNAHPAWYTVADGGIKNSGNAVKALAAGADAVMIGTAFSECLESEHDGRIRGSASKEFQEMFYGEVKKSVEGIELPAKKTVSIEKFLGEFVWNIKSAMTYTDSLTLEDLRKNAKFVSAGRGSIKEL